MQIMLYNLLVQTTGGTGGRTIKLPNPLGANTIPQLLDNIAGALVWFAAPIVTLMILVGAFQILTAGGNPENLIKGRKTITYAVIGFAVVLAAKSLSILMRNLLS